MRIVIATDAWSPQVNGVVTTLRQTREELGHLGHSVLMMTPHGRRSIPCPGYPEIRLALLQSDEVAETLQMFAPDAIHIATEGPVGLAVRHHCVRWGLPFTTAYHTRFPEYLRARAPIPVGWTSALLRRFHSRATRVMAPTWSTQQMLESRGFGDVAVWSRGVDTRLFCADEPCQYDLTRPIWVNVGRVAAEKNIEAFLNLPLPGSKVVIGDGPDRERLMRKWPDCHFPGYRFGEDLASMLAGADAFVFPSKTDTFGLVMLEAMACGLPVAAFPVTGPVDVVRNGVTGSLHPDLEQACLQALSLNPAHSRAYAESRSWRAATEQFLAHLAPIGKPRPATPQMTRLAS